MMSSLFRYLARQTVNNSRPTHSRMRVESLEAREVPAVDLLSIANSDFPTNKPLFVPITVNTADGPVSYSVTSNQSNVTAEIVTGGRSIQLTVRGTDANNQTITGTITLRLFEDIAPLATANIVQLVKNGYYDGKLFHRVVNDFVIQGGSPNGDGQGGATSVNDVRDEYNPQYTFASRGIVAMANAGDDNNNAQFFITDPFILQGGTEVNAPLDRRSEFLNFNHSVVGIMTSGFDIYQKIMNVPKGLGSDGAVSKPTNNVTVTKAVVLDTNVDGLVKLTAVGGFLGSADISVTATEGSSVQDKSFTVTSVADTVNDRPFLGSLSNLNTTPGTAKTFTLPFTELDAGDSLTFTAGRVVNTANGPVFTTLDPSQATISVTQDGQVTITPAAGFTGVIDFVVGVRDQQDRIGSSLGLNDARNFDTEEITLTVAAAANTSPVISDIANQTSAVGVAVGPVSFTISDGQTAVGSLLVTATSSNTALLSNSNIVLGGTTGTRTFTLTPTANQTGVTTVTVTVTDGGGLFTTDTFTYTVTGNGNTAPTISSIADQTGSSNVFGPLSFTVGDTQTAVGSLTVTATSSNLTLIPNANLVFGGSGASRTITATSVTGQTGRAQITVTVTDGDGATAVETFVVNVTPPSTIALTSSKTTTSTGRPVLLTATTTNATDASVQFRDGDTILGTVKVVDNKAFFTASFADGASHSVTARLIPASGAAVDSTPVTVTNTTSAAPILITATGSAAGTPNTVTVRNSDGSVRFTKNPYGSFTGVVRVKVGDVTGDGQLDVIAVPGFGGGPHIVVFDGNTGNLVFQSMIYGDNFRGGLSLDVGDAKGLGYAQILVGAGLSGGPRVTLLDASNNTVLLNYFAYENANRGGVSVAIGDLRGGNVPNIITGAGQGLGPNINVYNPFTTNGFQTPATFGTFVAGSKTDVSGVRIGVGPLVDNSRRDILVGDLDTADLTALSQTFNPQTLGVFVGTTPTTSQETAVQAETE